MALKFTTSYLEDSLALFRHYKKMAEGAIAQVTDEQLFTTLDDEMNSIAVIIKHMAGNMRSRWTDFLTTDGEKPDRNRDTEFVDPPATRESLMQTWSDGWNAMFAAIGAPYGCRYEPDGRDPGRSPLSDAGHQSSDGALCLPLRPDRISGEAPPPQ